MAGKKAVVAGATGSVGRLIVQTCLKDNRIESLTAVVRKTVDAEKAKELWGTSDMSKLSQVEVDFASLDANDTKLKGAFQGTDAFLTGLGLYSGNSTQKQMEDVEVKYNSILATIAHAAGAKRGAYLSGQGVKQPSTEGRAMAMFARVKGQAEETMAGIFSGPSEAHVAVRPGAIFDRPGEAVYGVVDKMMDKWPLKKLKDTKYGISANDIAKGMVQGALFDDEETVKGNTIWENNTIKEASQRYEKYFEENEN